MLIVNFTVNKKFSDFKDKSEVVSSKVLIKTKMRAIFVVQTSKPGTITEVLLTDRSL